MELVSRAYSTFTTQELERLTAYRAAVEAGFYTDWDGSAESTDTEVLAWLRAADTSGQTEAYPFTAQERQGLERCRAALVSGAYAEDGPPVDTAATPEAHSR